MKILRVLLPLLLALAALAATPPAPPANPVNPLLPPASPIVLTNVQTVYTNIALKSLTLDFQNVSIYGGTNAFKGSLLISWTASPSVVAGYNLYYGPTTLAQTNKYATQAQVTTVMFCNMFNTNLNYWAYVCAFDTNGLESVPSNQIVFTGR